MTVTKAELQHPDLDAAFAQREIAALEALMDAELEKGDAADFDLIDACAEAVNALRSGTEAAALPPISHKAFMKALGVRSSGGARIAIAAGLAAALLLAAASQLRTAEDVTVAQAVAQRVAALFNAESRPVPEEKPSHAPVTVPAQPTQQTPAAAPAAVGLRIDAGEEWKTEYPVGAAFEPAGLTVYVQLADGSERAADYTAEPPADFGAAAGEAAIVIRAAGQTETLTVRVLDTLETPKLNSIYAVFPADFDFAAAQAPVPAGTEIYAVYSDGSEQRLAAAEVAVTTAPLADGRTLVTLAYADCTASYVITERKG